jgi:hypothetical protein
MDKMCPKCFGIGWVCENHPDRAWSEELGCRYGPGMPCKCNRTDEPDTSEVFTEEISRGIEARAKPRTTPEEEV